MESKINNEINTFYNSQLYLILDGKIIYSNDKVGTDYDFSDSIINDIDTYISEGLEKVKKLTKMIEGSQYEINNISEVKFINIKEEVIAKIKNKFVNFTLKRIEKENNEFSKSLENIFMNNFENILNDIIPSYTNDFFERILKFNEIQKIKVLYENLKYLMYQGMIYYLNLSDSNQNLNLPKNIKDDILTFNDIANTIKIKSNEIFCILNETILNYNEQERQYITQKYITDIISDLFFESQFNININQMAFSRTFSGSSP